jgi:hypothetical protein
MTFNLKKSYVEPMADLILPDPGIEPDFGTDQPMVDLEWNNGGQDMYTTQGEMVDSLGGVDAMREKYMGIKENPDDSRNIANEVEQIKMMSAKPFNLKKAQGMMPMGTQPLDAQPQLLDQQQEAEPTKTYETHSDLNNMLIEVANSPNAFQISWNNILKENPQEADSAQAALKSYFQGLEMKGPEQQLKDAEIIHELIYGKEDIMPIDAEYKELGASVNETSKIIKKLAQKSASRNKKKAYNLTKTAQHKTLDNAILYGPGETRIDPFLHQPVSDWHIVERNKGFGLVVDDIWNIDYETIWRENVMDKYSRPYKNKEGKWVGGYLNKRFEIDSNVPETNNMQLKPGQLRRPILPEYGNTESRLQAARAKGDIAGAIDTSKPFNWKEASSKKKS